MKSLTRILLLTFSLCAFTQAAPGILNHQGRIAVGGTNFDGTGHFKFALVDATETLLHWSNSPDAVLPADGIPDVAVSVAVSKGHYSVALGDAALGNMDGPIPDSIFADNSELYLRVWFSTNAARPFEELTPKRRLTSAAFSLHAAKAAGVVDGGVTETMLAAGSVSTPKLAAGAVDNTILAPGTAGENIDTAGSVGIGLAGADPAATVQLAGDIGYPDPALLAQIKDGDAGFTELALAASVFVSGTTAYVTAANDSALTIVDVSDPAAPVALAVLKDGVSGFDELGGARGVFVSGMTAYVTAAADSALTIIDVSTPAVPVLLAVLKDGVGGFDELGGAWAVQVVGTTAYVVSRVDDSLTIIDVSAPASPSLVAVVKDGVGGFDHLADPRALFVSGSKVYVPSFQDNALTIIDVSTPASPKSLGVAIDGVGGFRSLAGARSVHVFGTTALVTGFYDDALTIIDVSTPSSPSPLAEIVDGVGGFEHLDGARFVDVSGTTACVASFDDDSLTFIDISSPASPVLIAEVVDGVGGFTELDGASGVHFSGTIAYAVSNFDDALTIVDTTAESLVDIATANRVGIGTSAPRAMLEVAGDAFFTGSLKDSSQQAGTSGQMLSSTGAGTSWIDLLDNDPSNELQTMARAGSDLTLSNGGGTVSINDADANAANELQSLSLAGDNLTLSAGNTVDLGQYLRSDVSDSYSAGTLTFAPGTNAQFNGTLSVGADSGSDNDAILFDASNEALTWLNSATRFQFSDDLTIQGALQVGGSTGAGYNRMGTGVTGHGLGNSDDLLVSDDVEVEGTIFADGDIEVGARLYLSGQIRMNNADEDQAIYFYDQGSQTNEFLYWDDAEDAFRFSNDVAFTNGIQLGSPTSSVLYNRAGTAVTDHGLADPDDFLISASLEVDENLYADAAVYVGTDDSTDNDVIWFDGLAEPQLLIWDNADHRFELSNDLAISGALNAGNNSFAKDYNFFSAGPPAPSSGDISGESDVFIADDLEVGGSIHGTIVGPSDRNIKERFVPVAVAEILDKVAAMPITTWQYKDRHEEDEEPPRHIGPVAQDFHAAFGLGDSDRHIFSIDADGIALAAIQALKAENDALRKQNAEILKRLDALEQKNRN